MTSTVMTKIMKAISVGNVLNTPTGTPFKILAISHDSITIDKRYPHTGELIKIPKDCFESIPQFLSGKGWVEIRAIQDKPGIVGTFDWHCKKFTNGIMVGSYVAPILEKAEILKIYRNKPNKVLLIENASISKSNTAEIMPLDCPKCGGELDLSKIDEKGVVKCPYCKKKFLIDKLRI